MSCLLYVRTTGTCDICFLFLYKSLLVYTRGKGTIDEKFIFYLHYFYASGTVQNPSDRSKSLFNFKKKY